MFKTVFFTTVWLVLVFLRPGVNASTEVNNVVYKHISTGEQFMYYEKGAAKELFGIVNVAVVDCGGYNRELCRSIPQVTGFPSVLVYFGGKEPVKFTDNRLRKNFVKFAKKYVAGQPVDLWTGNIEEVVAESNLPWFIYLDRMKEDIDMKIINSIGK